MPEPGPRIHLTAFAIAGAAMVAACSTTSDTAPVVTPTASAPAETVSAGSTTIAVAETTPLTIASTDAPSTAVDATTDSTSTPPARSAPSTSTPPPSTTSSPIPLDVFDPACVVRAPADASFEQIGLANGIPDPVGLWLENGRVDVVGAGDLVDICPANSINDIDGAPREPLGENDLRSAIAENVERQQSKLNELFAGYGITALDVDGDSGPRTGQRLCAARLALGLDTTIADMAPGSNEQAVLFASTSLPTPEPSAIEFERWVLIDRTCQIMFVGSGPATTFVFPTSTGSAGFETRLQDRSEVFRFNPALDNGGWHNSNEFPVGVDNPLNGNLYKPLYFDLGQAIHGANNVPPTPESKGCARLRVEDQEALVAWLGLDTETGESWRKDELNLRVTVQGEFVPR